MSCRVIRSLTVGRQLHGTVIKIPSEIDRCGLTLLSALSSVPELQLIELKIELTDSFLLYVL